MKKEAIYQREMFTKKLTNQKIKPHLPTVMRLLTCCPVIPLRKLTDYNNNIEYNGNITVSGVIWGSQKSSILE